MLRRESGSANGCLWAMASWYYRRAALHRRHCIIFLGEMNIPLGTVTAEKGRFNQVTPRKLRWQWKVTKGKYIFKWLVFHCHISFTGCISCYLQKTPIAICASQLFWLRVPLHVSVQLCVPSEPKGSFWRVETIKEGIQVNDLEACYEVLFRLHQNFRRNSVIL